MKEYKVSYFYIGNDAGIQGPVKLEGQLNEYASQGWQLVWIQEISIAEGFFLVLEREKKEW